MTHEISDLRLFVRIVAAGSLSEAARRNNGSLAAISRRLAALEERLGVRLIERGSRRFTLTEEGSTFLERAEAILRDIDAAEAEVMARSRRPRGHMRIGAPLEIGRRRIAPLVAEFTARYPDISIELILNDAHVDILEEEIDIGLFLDEPADGSLIRRILLRSRRVTVASPSYLAQRPPVLRPADLLSHDCARLIRGRRIFDRWKYRENGRPTEIRVTGRLLSNNAELIHQWAVDGHAVAYKAFWDVEEDIRAGRLVRLLEPYEHDDINLYVVYSSRAHLPPRMRLFIDFMADRIRGG
ncbi:LysR family transcriptional regulator [Camelimonas abortus]|uniref:LysR family transcriptional regulator n=1 Tax=Camelimonas abortus TaxID=1017184 RepID=A0ABV7LD60_9HYPH